MKEGTVVGLRQPGSFSDDPLTDILRSGARQLLAQAIEAEVGAHIAAHSDLTDGSGRRRVVRKLNDEQMLQFMGRENLERDRIRLTHSLNLRGSSHIRLARIHRVGYRRVSMWLRGTVPGPFA